MKIGTRTSEEKIGFTGSIYIARNIICFSQRAFTCGLKKLLSTY